MAVSNLYPVAVYIVTRNFNFRIYRVICYVVDAYAELIVAYVMNSEILRIFRKGKFIIGPSLIFYNNRFQHFERISLVISFRPHHLHAFFKFRGQRCQLE